MKKWVLKALIQKIISFLPGSHKVNYWFQKYITKGVRLSESYFEDKLVHALDHLRFAKQAGLPISFKSLELGTGWYPVVPLSFYLAGAKHVTSIDLNRLMTKDSLCDCIEAFQKALKENKLEQFKDYFRSERIEQLKLINCRSMDEESLLLILNFEYRVGDARTLKDQDAEYDMIHSNNVFEHIYPEVLKEILQEFKRVLKPEGIMSHFIDMSDHFAHLDSSITIYNFLRYSEAQWVRIDNSVQPQNRWRLSDYEQLYAQLAFTIIQSETRPGEMEALEKTKLHKDFAHRSKEDLAVSHAHIVNTI